MNVLVCDDEQQIVDSIIETLEKKTEETQVSSRFYGVSQSSQIDFSLPYDIALLDIDMGEANGIELARKLRAENENIVMDEILCYMYSNDKMKMPSCIIRQKMKGIGVFMLPFFNQKELVVCSNQSQYQKYTSLLEKAGISYRTKARDLYPRFSVSG